MSGNTEISGSSKENPLQEFEEYEKLLKKLEENHRKSTRRMYLFFCLIFLVFVIVIGLSLVFIDNNFISELRSGNSSLMKNTDYLEIVLPILIAIVAAFIAFLGMNRLRDMDEQMDQMRNSIDIELDKEMKRVTALRKDLVAHVDDAIGQKTQDFADKMKKGLAKESKARLQDVEDGKQRAISAIETGIGELTELIQVSGDDLAKQIQADEERRKNFEDRYQWLLSNTETSSLLLKEPGSVYDVHKAVEELWNRNDKLDNTIALTQRYVEKVVENSSTIRGDADSYHNLAAECARHALYKLSCDVCEKGVEYFPGDIDLLADWVQYGAKLGNTQAVRDGPLAKLLTIDMTHWNWRVFDFTVNFYLAVAEFDAAEQLAEDFIQYLPYEERAYRSLADVREQKYAKEEGTEKVIEALQRATNQDIACPLCANRLAEILCDCGRLEEALDSANRALRDLSQEQPSINYGYVIYRRGLIQDRLAFQMQEAGDENARHIAKRAALDYQVAIGSHRLSAITERQAKVRYGLLNTYFDIGDD
ncbi:MAG: hypothetical protein LUF68_01450 [Clostridiales bacterium]|nr:hypothetical protein [Clostridiales bacterium]